MTTWAIDGNSWDGDQTNWDTASILGGGVLSVAPSIASSAQQLMANAISINTPSTISAAGVGRFLEATSVSATSAIVGAAAHQMAESVGVTAGATTAVAQQMTLVGAATVEGTASVDPICNGVYVSGINFNGTVTLVVDERLFWESSTTATTTWTDKSDDTKP
jgi:hypothetical protein